MEGKVVSFDLWSMLYSEEWQTATYHEPKAKKMIYVRRPWKLNIMLQFLSEE